jgi:Spy/CpxP family protein refolding chaperone
MKIHTITRSLIAISALLCMQQANAQEIISAGTNSTPVIADARVNACPKFSLSDSQLEKLRTLKDQAKLDTAQRKAQLKVYKHELFDLISKPSVDKEAALSLNTKINALKTELSNARLNFMLAAGDILTPEQKEQMRHRMLKRSVMGGKFGHNRASGHCGKSKGFKHRSFEHGKVTESIPAPEAESKNS